MRKALNENPMVQIGVIVVMLIVFAVMLFGTVLKGEETPEPTANTADPAAGATATPASPSTPAPTAPAPAGEAATPPTAPAAPEGDGGSFKASKGLPEDVASAYEANSAIALLVIDPKAVADEQLEEWTTTLGARRGVETFIVKTKDIADYARITQGVGVSSTPALIMVRPRNLTDDVPTATISTGFEGPRSLEQALDDALYDGRSRLPSEAYP